MSFFTSVAAIYRMLADLPPVDGATQNKLAAGQSQLTKPPGSLDRLEDIVIWMAGWQRTERPVIRHVQCLYLLAIMVLWRNRYCHLRQR